MTDTPKHVAIIMDGNGRWAKARGLPRSAGHKQGTEAARKVVSSAAELGVEYLTLFGFSAENWSRPEGEIKDLMNLLRYYLRSETAELHRNGARLKVIGDREALAADIVKLIENAESLTAENDKITVIIALNYGGRQDIVNAVHALMRKHKDVSKIELESLFPQYLSTHGIPDPDLMIRTSGERRISNFLLWECAYTEFVFTDVLWPDFGFNDLEAAIGEYTRRDRRFGAVKSSKG
ncbi:MAG: polyprenyl diphosphate synthase [Alphaproteobacteria bacterium]